MGVNRYFAALIVASLMASGPASANRVGARPKLGEANPKKGPEALAALLNQLMDTPEMRTSKLSPNLPAGAVDRNSGNPSQADTSNHYYNTSTCMEWLQDQWTCKRWMDAGVSAHVFEETDPATPGSPKALRQSGDFSKAEQIVAANWVEREQVDGGGQYKIWQIQRMGDSNGSNVDAEGKLDLNGVTYYSLIPEVAEQLKALGKQTGARSMLRTYEMTKDGAKNRMPNEVALRVQAATFTQQFRDRLETNLKEQRAASAPSDFLLSEEVPDCETYVARVEAEMAREPKFEERLGEQGRLKPEAKRSLEDRLLACQQAVAAGGDVVNPQEGQPGDPEQEPIDQALTRLNLAAIDRAGVDLNELPKPSYVQLTEGQVKSEFAEFETGGLSLRGIKNETNAKTLNDYNNSLETAALSLKNVQRRLPQLQNNGDQIRAFKVAPATQSSVAINGLTPEMKRDLASTSFAPSPLMASPDGDRQTLQEQIQTELTVTPQ